MEQSRHVLFQMMGEVIKTVIHPVSIFGELDWLVKCTDMNPLWL
ncbi:MAG: hypothetical protein R2788_01130 [Saprospiraceae bacterium]